MNPASLDQAKVAELEELQEGLFERLALLFLQESPTDMALLGDALAAGDAARAKTTAHRIKGSAAAVGAVGVSSGAADLEQAAARGDVPAARRALGHLEGTLGALRGALRSTGVVPPRAERPRGVKFLVRVADAPDMALAGSAAVRPPKAPTRDSAPGGGGAPMATDTAHALPSSGLELLPKAPTGIQGLDEVTGGGLPRGRSTLVCGPAGCGKTLLGLEFLVRGITDYGEAGVFVAFEETREDLIANVASLGFDLSGFEAEGQLALDHVGLDPSEIVQSGDWDLEGLFVRLEASIEAVSADRVVIDTIENLFAAFPDSATVRSELRRLFRWLKDRGVTAIITGERGTGGLTRHGIEEYVSDCVIVLDHRVSEETSTRRLRVLKYRGSHHGTNEYPFLIGKAGVTVVPITSLGLEHDASGETLSMGVDRLDEMLGGRGVLRGSSILVSGTAGTGKSTVAANFCDAACRRGERALYFAFEESEAQIVRNMGSVGMDLQQWVDQGLLQFKCARPSLLGLEAHLSSMQDLVTEFEPSVVVLDPISDLLTAGASRDVSAMLTRQVDFLKVRGVTALFTSLDQDLQLEEANQQIAALIDVWLLVTTQEHNGERNRALSVLKARGMAHSNQVREFLLTSQGIDVAGVHGLGEVLTGSARVAQEASRRSEAGLDV